MVGINYNIEFLRPTLEPCSFGENGPRTVIETSGEQGLLIVCTTIPFHEVPPLLVEDCDDIPKGFPHREEIIRLFCSAYLKWIAED